MLFWLFSSMLASGAWLIGMPSKTDYGFFSWYVFWEAWPFGMSSKTNVKFFAPYFPKTLTFSKHLGQCFSHKIYIYFAYMHLLVFLFCFYLSENDKWKFCFRYCHLFSQYFLLKTFHIWIYSFSFRVRLSAWNQCWLEFNH